MRRHPTLAANLCATAALVAAVGSAAAEDPVLTNDRAFMTTFDTQYEKAWGTGAMPAKYKQLAGIALSISIRCEACLTYHIRMAVQEKGSREEVIEAMRLGLVAGGSAGIPTLRAGYAELNALIKP